MLRAALDQPDQAVQGPVHRRGDAQRGADLEVRSILDDPRTLAAYRELIPVIEVDGAVVATWRITAEQLRAALDPPTR